MITIPNFENTRFYEGLALFRSMELIPKIGIFEIMLKPLVEGYAFILRGSPIFEKSKYANRHHNSSTNYCERLELKVCML